MKNKERKILIILIIVLLSLIVFLTKTYKVDKAEPKEYNNTKTEQTIKTNSNDKVEVYNSFKKILSKIENVSSFNNIEKIANNSNELYKIVPEEMKNDIYLFDTFSGEEFESLSFQTLMFINEAIKKEKTDFDNMSEKEQKVLLASLPIDKEKGYAVLPLGIFSPYLTGYSVDMFLVDGEWKPMMINTISQIKAADNMISALENEKGDK